MAKLDKITALELKIDAMMRKFDSKEIKNIPLLQITTIKTLYEGLALGPPYNIEEVQYVTGNMSYYWRLNNLPTHYHPSLRNHENLSSRREFIMCNSSIF